jgi:hypothetical protein
VSFQTKHDSIEWRAQEWSWNGIQLFFLRVEKPGGGGAIYGKVAKNLRETL